MLSKRAKVSLQKELTAALMLGNDRLALMLADLVTPPVNCRVPRQRGNHLEPVVGEIPHAK